MQRHDRAPDVGSLSTTKAAPARLHSSGAGARSPGGPLTPATLVQLQRSVGNAAVSKMLSKQLPALQRHGAMGAPVVYEEEEPSIQRLPRTTEVRLQRISAQEQADQTQFFTGGPRQVTDFTPANRTGYFDATLDPATGKMAVIVKLHFDFRSWDSSVYSDPKWTVNEANAWVQKFKDGIANTWNNQAEFVLTRPEWQALRVRPKFKVQPTYTLWKQTTAGNAVGPTQRTNTPAGGMAAGRAGAHYVHDVFRGGSADYRGARQHYPANHPGLSAMGKPAKDAHIINDPFVQGGGGGGRLQGSGGLHGADADFMQHNAFFLSSITQGERNVLRNLLGDPLLVTLAHKGLFRKVVGVHANSANALQQFVSDRNSVYPKLVLPVPLIITGPAKHTAVVQTFLATLGLPNPIVVQTGKGGVRITVDKTFVATATDDVGSQLTVAHEFGHMLGVPDDYNAMTAVSKGKMKDYAYSDPAAGLNIALDDALSAKLESASAGASAPKHGVAQEGFIDLCNAAGAPIPTTFGLKHNTMMGAGDEFLAHHFVTVWDCLTTMARPETQPSWWKIDMR